MKRNKGISELHRRFVDEHLKNPMTNLYEIYETIYGKAKNKGCAKVTATRIMGRPEVLEYMKKQQEKFSNHSAVTTERIIEELSKIAFDTSEGSKKIRANDKNKALELLGRIKGAFNDKLKVDLTVDELIEED